MCNYCVTSAGTEPEVLVSVQRSIALYSTFSSQETVCDMKLQHVSNVKGGKKKGSTDT